MKFYVRELPQKQYYHQIYNFPVLPSKCKDIKPGDIWCSTWEDYYIDKVEYVKDDLIVYATMTKLSKPRNNCSYKKVKKEEMLKE